MSGYEYGTIGRGYDPVPVGMYRRGNPNLRSAMAFSPYVIQPMSDNALGAGSLIRYYPHDTAVIIDGTRLIYARCLGGHNSGNIGVQGYVPAHAIEKATFADPVLISKSSGDLFGRTMRIRFTSASHGALPVRWKSSGAFDLSYALDAAETDQDGEDVVEVYLVS